MKAIKGNKEYSIEESQKAFYVNEGFDIVDEDGDIVSYGKGKTVPYENYISAVKRIEVLEEIITELRTELEAARQDGGQAPGGEVTPEETTGTPTEEAAAEPKDAAKKGK